MALVMGVLALAVVGEHLDHSARGYPAVPASLDHHFQLGFEGGQATQALLDFGEPGLGDHIGRAAGLVGIVLQGDQGADRLDLEAQLAGMADKGQAMKVGRLVVPTVSFAARRGGQ